MSAAPEVSVILTLRGGEERLSGTVAGVLARSLRDWELLIVPWSANPPADPKPYSGPADARIRFLSERRPDSAAEAFNAGALEARAPWLVWLNGREIPFPDMLEECLRLVDRNPDIAIAYGDRAEAGEAKRTLPSDEFDAERIKRNDGIPDCALFPKKAWVDVGGFRTNVPGAEAWDFWIACASRGYRGRRIPVPLALFRSDGSDGEASGKDARIAQIRVNNRESYSHDETQAAEVLLGSTAGSAARPSYHIARRPLVSVVIPTYNRSDTLSVAVASVLAQTLRDFEIIVVSDSGSNALEQALKDLNSRQNITYVRHGVNRGLGASRNTGVGVARGKYVAYLDDDDFFYPDHLETLVGYLENTGEKVAYADAHRVWQAKENGVYVELKRDAPYMHDFNYDLILVHNFVPVQCFVHARECEREVGGFDETLSTHEDWDLWIRLSRKYRMNRIPRFTSAFTYREDGSNMSARRKSNFLDTTLAIYSKYADFVRDKPEVRSAQATRIANMRMENGLPPEAKAEVHVSSRHARALAMLNAGNARAAADVLEALAAEGADSRLINDLAVARYRSGQEAAAEAGFRKSLELDSGFAPAYRNLGMLFFRRGSLAEALQFLRKAYERDPGDPETSLSLGELSESVGQSALAGEFYRRTLELDPENVRARERLSGSGNPASAPALPAAGMRES